MAKRRRGAGPAASPPAAVAAKAEWDHADVEGLANDSDLEDLDGRQRQGAGAATGREAVAGAREQGCMDSEEDVPLGQLRAMQRQRRKGARLQAAQPAGLPGGVNHRQQQQTQVTVNVEKPPQPQNGRREKLGSGGGIPTPNNGSLAAATAAAADAALLEASGSVELTGATQQRQQRRQHAAAAPTPASFAIPKVQPAAQSPHHRQSMAGDAVRQRAASAPRAGPAAANGTSISPPGLKMNSRSSASDPRQQSQQPQHQAQPERPRQQHLSATVAPPSHVWAVPSSAAAPAAVAPPPASRRQQPRSLWQQQQQPSHRQQYPSAADPAAPALVDAHNVAGVLILKDEITRAVAIERALLGRRQSAAGQARLACWSVGWLC